MRETSNYTISDRSPAGLTSIMPSAVHQGGGVKRATGASSKIRGRDNTTIGTWNTRTLRAAGKLQELTHEMGRYRWNILGLCDRYDKHNLENLASKTMRHFWWGIHFEQETLNATLTEFVSLNSNTKHTSVLAFEKPRWWWKMHRQCRFTLSCSRRQPHSYVINLLHFYPLRHGLGNATDLTPPCSRIGYRRCSPRYSEHPDRPILSGLWAEGVSSLRVVIGYRQCHSPSGDWLIFPLFIPCLGAVLVHFRMFDFRRAISDC